MSIAQIHPLMKNFSVLHTRPDCSVCFYRWWSLSTDSNRGVSLEVVRKVLEEQQQSNRGKRFEAAAVSSDLVSKFRFLLFSCLTNDML